MTVAPVHRMPENKKQPPEPPKKQDQPKPVDKDRNKMGQRQGEGKNLDDLEDIDQGDIDEDDRVTQRHPAMPNETDKDRR